MNYSDTLYRALVDYRKNTLEQNECKTQRAAIVPADSENDKIIITRQNCIVEEDWLNAIEYGLEFIEKAINEGRQFIRSNGEVIPIEKVKRVSKDSVEHLARHSNYFTREQESGEDLIPDQLYTVERLSDYAVYENRFLYMLLCYLRDFIGMRYEKILELTNTYNGVLEIDKAVVESNRNLHISVKLEEEKKDDDYLREHNKAQKQIDRILTAYKAVVLYLNTPLMVEVAKTPMIKPPIMRTNVLKMNRNFKEALSLYEYITAYDKDGYTIKTETRKLSPFNNVAGDEFAEVTELASFLTYEHGLGIRDYFKKRYDEEEVRRIDAERLKTAEQIRNIARRLKTDNVTADEYILLLEKRIRDLEKVEEELKEARAKLSLRDKEVEKLQNAMNDLREQVHRLGEDMTALHQEYAFKIDTLQVEHAEKLNACIAEYQQKIEDIHAEYKNTIEELKRVSQEEKDALNERLQALQEEKQAAEEAHEQALRDAQAEYTEKLRTAQEEHDLQTARLKEELKKSSEEWDALSVRYEHEKEEKVLLSARYKALCLKHGGMVDDKDYTTKSGMDELEKEYLTFKRFFDKEWAKTKKRIRLDMLGSVKEIIKDIFAKKEDDPSIDVGVGYTDKETEQPTIADETATANRDEKSEE